MATWRSIADQLTASQIDNLEWLETNPVAGLPSTPQEHLTLARGWANYNLVQCLHADVVPPADAVDVGPWVLSAAGVRRREYTATETGVAGRDITLEVRGTQYTDGRADGRLALTGDGLAGLDAEAVRRLAAALLAAAERLGAGP